MADRLRALVDSVLLLVERDAAFCTRAIERAIGARRVRIEVGDESFVVETNEADAVTTAPRGAADIRVTSSKAAILDLIDGRTDLLTSVLANAVRVQASPADAGALFDALRAFVEGGARSRDTGPLLETYRAPSHHSSET